MSTRALLGCSEKESETWQAFLAFNTSKVRIPCDAAESRLWGFGEEESIF